MGGLIVVALVVIAAANAACWWFVYRGQAAALRQAEQDRTEWADRALAAERAARRELAAADSYADALASVLDKADWAGLDAVRAHAKQALAGGNYHGRLRATQEALETEVTRNEDLDRQVALLAENLVGEP